MSGGNMLYSKLSIDNISTNGHCVTFKLKGTPLMKTIPFDLKKALDGYRILTKTGDWVTDFKYWDSLNTLSVLVTHKNGSQAIYGYTIHGKIHDSTDENEYDLVLIARPKKYYVSVMQRKDGSFFTCNSRDSIESCMENESSFDETMTLFTRLEFEAEE